MSDIEKVEIPVKRILVLVLVMALALGAVTTAEAAKKKKKKPKRIERVVEIPYEHPGIGLAGPVSGGFPVNFPEGSSEVPLGAKELFLKIEVVDQSGQAVAGFISQGDIDGNGVNDDGYGEFCETHEDAVPIEKPGAPIIGIYAFNGTCGDGTPSVMTSGVVKVTLSNLP